MNPIRLGLVGANKQGREHLVDAQGVAIVAATDTSSDVLEALARDYPTIHGYPSLDEMVKKEELHGLVIAVPHHVVPIIWSDLLTHRLPLLKEKPLGRTLAEAHSLIASARQASVPIVTAIQRRTHPSYKKLAELIQTQAVRSLSATLHLGFDPTRASQGWRGDRNKAGGGALLDSGYHMVDLAQHLVGVLSFVHANLWCLDKPASPQDTETDAIVIARAGSVWVRLESRVGGRPDPAKPGGFLKYERVMVETNQGLYEADRSGTWYNGAKVFECPTAWRDGMETQLERFARMIRDQAFDSAIVWDQVAAMRIIESAYRELGRFGAMPLTGAE